MVMTLHNGEYESMVFVKIVENRRSKNFQVIVVSQSVRLCLLA